MPHATILEMNENGEGDDNTLGVSRYEKEVRTKSQFCDHFVIALEIWQLNFLYGYIMLLFIQGSSSSQAQKYDPKNCKRKKMPEDEPADSQQMMIGIKLWGVSSSDGLTNGRCVPTLHDPKNVPRLIQS